MGGRRLSPKYPVAVHLTDLPLTLILSPGGERSTATERRGYNGGRKRRFAWDRRRYETDGRLRRVLEESFDRPAYHTGIIPLDSAGHLW